MGDYNDAFLRNNNNAVQARTKQVNRANVIQMKLIGQSHPTGLTNNLLKLFEPRPPLEYKPPPEKRKCPQYTGMAQFVSKFAEQSDPEYAPPVQKGETPAERRARIHQLRLEEGAKKAAEELEKYDPNADPSISGDPYKTLFVARLNYETTESRIKREFEAYGPIKRDDESLLHREVRLGGPIMLVNVTQVRLVADKETNKPRGYAFIEYMHTRDMKAAYKQADGRKLDNRRVLVDVERGRTVPNWRPRRLGGGLGTTRVGGEEVNQRTSGREQQQQSGAPPRSEEPRVREDRDRDREKSREREKGRDREREKSRERSHDRPRDREHRDDRHHRDRDRNKEKERDRGGRDKIRDRDRGRDYERDRDRGRDRNRGDRERHREKERDRDRDYEVGDGDYERGRSRDRDHEYDRGREKRYDQVEPEDDDSGWYEPSDGGSKRVEGDRGHGGYDYYDRHQGRAKYDDVDAQGDPERYEQPDRYDQMDEDNYEPAKPEARDKDREYKRSDRSHSREYDY